MKSNRKKKMPEVLNICSMPGTVLKEMHDDHATNNFRKMSASTGITMARETASMGISGMIMPACMPSAL